MRALINQEFLDAEYDRLDDYIQCIMSVISIIQLVRGTNQNISSMGIMERMCRYWIFLNNNYFKKTFSF